MTKLWLSRSLLQESTLPRPSEGKMIEMNWVARDPNCDPELEAAQKYMGEEPHVALEEEKSFVPI